MISFLRKLTPNFLMKAYHYALAWLAHIWYGMPSKKMYVIGVTGTKGKTTTCHMIREILEELGERVGMTSSVQFFIAGERRLNDLKQGMPGRFYLQGLLAEMVKKGCTHAVVETTSEGMLQYRHRFIDYRMAIFTNLSPEHIERHGGFENYRATKVGLFEKLARRKDGIGVYNLDDPNVGYFLKPEVSRKVKFSLSQLQSIKLTDTGSSFDIEGVRFEIPLVGEFNVYNAAAAISAARALGVSLEKCAEALRNPTRVSGRFEIVQREPFAVVVDYAHEPKSLEEAYKAAKLFLKDKGRLVCVLGATGGGRDSWKRPEMGKVAAGYCDEIVLTNEDPYDESPIEIIRDVRKGVDEGLRIKDQGLRVYEIVDRKEAIKKAISLAGLGDVVILTGKGGEVWMCLEKGKKVPWDETKIVETILEEARRQ